MEFHFVSHTHWDREWYRTAEEFRQRLVDLIDELIADPPHDGESFLLDGQAIVLEDYLAVKPTNRDRLRGLLQAGRLEAGPWFVLADELIPSGEALVRNLLVGRASLDALGATSPPILYCPDSFGHPAALPELAAGFGLPLIILWRGYGGRRSHSGDTFRWKAPSGREAIVFHLPPDGYEFGSSLPLAAAEAGKRWKRIRDTLAPRATLGLSLIQNGADHHARQTGLREAVAALTEQAAATGDKLIVSSMRNFADALTHRASSQTLRMVSGELRDSYGYTWTLQGTFGTRAAQKRANAIAERTLRRAESWCAVAKLLGGPSRIDHLRAAWKSLLEAHPHDTLCGTSIDAVAAAMDQRVASARRQGAALAKGAMETLAGHDAATARESEEERQDRVVIVNPVAYPRGGVVIVETIDKLVDEPVGPGSQHTPWPAGGKYVQWGGQFLTSGYTRNRIESTRHYPDNDIVRSRIEAHVVPPQPGWSVSAFAQVGLEPTTPVSASRTALANGIITVKADKKGVVSLQSGESVLENLLVLEDRSDQGDSYTPSIGRVITSAKLAEQELVHGGPLVGELAQEWSLAREKRKPHPPSSVRIAMRVVADSPLLELRIRGVNRARNHRLRIGIATGVAGASVLADAAFGPIERKPLSVPGDDQKMETPPPTAPLHRYVSLFSKSAGVTIHSDGLAEYEAEADGIVWVTLVRAIGQLSRSDIPERPGHAGWPEATPKAQSLGPFAARLAIQIHAGNSAATLQAIDRESDRFLNPMRGFTLRSSISRVTTTGGVELSRTALSASAIKETEDGRGIVLRCVNLSERDQTGTWTLPVAVDSAQLARLDETPLQPLDAREEDGRTVIAFTAGPRAVVTIVAVPRR